MSSARPRASYTDDIHHESEALDPNIFLSQATNTSTDEKLVEQKRSSWKDLTEIEDEEFERAMRELSAREWELMPEELDELKVLESTVYVSSADDGQDGAKYLDKGYLQAVSDDLDAKSEEKSRQAGEDKTVSKDAASALKESKELLDLYNNNDTTSNDTSDAAGMKELTQEERDIEEQADRLVKMYASLPNSGIVTKDGDDDGDKNQDDADKDEDEEAVELVDMYVRLASSEEDSDDEAKANPEIKNKNSDDDDDDDDNADLFARLDALKSLPSHSSDNTTPALPDAPTLPHVLPSVPIDTSPQTKKLREDAELGCCMCSDDVEYRCLGCEKDDEDNYLYCGKCFLLSELSSI